MDNKSLEHIGFYTLSDHRVKNISGTSPLWRAELIVSTACNFKCPYCRELRSDCKGSISMEDAKSLVDLWAAEGLKNVRFSGGEPTVWKGLQELVAYTKTKGVEHIAISTNGSAPLWFYKKLIENGVNDFSISLDACCSSVGETMTGGIKNAWEKVVKNIEALSKLTYVTVGVVFTETNIPEAIETVKFAHNLGVADIRVISAAQWNEALTNLLDIPEEILKAHPILEYRIRNFRNGKHVRGIKIGDSGKCFLVQDDMAVAGGLHFPCIIYLREGGAPIGKVGCSMRADRVKWFEKHNSHLDPICSKNCLDVCTDFNNRARDLKR